MKIELSFNKGLKGWDDKLLGIGIEIWGNPLEIEINLLFWTLWISQEWRPGK